MSSQVYTISAGQRTELPSVEPGSIVVNRSTAQTVWVGDQNVATGQGVPVPPLASVPLKADTNKYLRYAVCLDSAATGPASIIVTDDISDYNDPVGVAVAAQNAQDLANKTAAAIQASTLAGDTAAATSTQLTNNGVPAKVYRRTLASGATLPANSTIVYEDITDISEFTIKASVAIGGTPYADGIVVSVNQLDGTINNTVAYNLIQDGIGITLKAEGSKLQIANRGNQQVIYTLVGNNRAAVTRFANIFAPEQGQHWLVGGAGMVAGTAYGFADQNAIACFLQGACTMYAQIQGTTVKGRIRLNRPDGNIIPIADTNEFVTTSDGSARILCKQISLPGIIAGSWDFLCAVAGSATVRMYIYPNVL